MCGRGSLTKVESELEERFNATFYSEDLERYNPLPSFNIAPTHFHPVIPQEDVLHFQYYKWGLIPFWAKDQSIGSKMINARIEGLLEKPFFKSALQKRRCLVPMDGFYEWQKTNGKQKIPLRIGVKNQEIFSMAGLYDNWKDPNGNIIRSFTIITQAANQFMSTIHDRMPSILLPEDEKTWLEDDLAIEQSLALLQAYPNEWMTAYEVSDAVNNVRNNDKTLILPR
ncbi:MAG: SOS response-associated peptidase [Saprospiraceae bacterium]|nr:SOS response-associated peptidase [Saprospiraceae bacterium]